eukprot:8302041-Pyramimonas_sp.AAC.2
MHTTTPRRPISILVVYCIIINECKKKGGPPSQGATNVTPTIESRRHMAGCDRADAWYTYIRLTEPKPDVWGTQSPSRQVRGPSVRDCGHAHAWYR